MRSELQTNLIAGAVLAAVAWALTVWIDQSGPAVVVAIAGLVFTAMSVRGLRARLVAPIQVVAGAIFGLLVLALALGWLG